MRSRNLKPSFFANEDLAELPFETRLLYQGLWCYADREGRFEWRPRKIKVLVFPYDNAITADVIECHLMSLHVMTLILQYKVDGVFYGHIPSFLKHQRPHPHEAKSVIPGPEKGEYTAFVPRKEKLSSSKEQEQNQCHDMSLNVIKCQPDIRNPKRKRKNILSSKLDDGNVDSIPYQEIIEYLNSKTGKGFRHTTMESRKFIKARWNAGFRLEDFKRVIDNKVAKWLRDPEYSVYLRPETLFGTKFEAYLNEIPGGTGSTAQESHHDPLTEFLKLQPEEQKFWREDMLKAMPNAEAEDERHQNYHAAVRWWEKEGKLGR